MCVLTNAIMSAGLEISLGEWEGEEQGARQVE